MVSVEIIHDSKQRAKDMDAFERQYERIDALYSHLVTDANKEHLDRLKEIARNAKRRYVKAIMRFNVINATRDVYMNPKEYRNMDIIMSKVQNIERLFDHFTNNIGEERVNQLVNRYRNVMRIGYNYLSNMEDETSSPYEVIHKDVYRKEE